jgi:acyl-coenzyme A thioesterase PaaI-like protein
MKFADRSMGMTCWYANERQPQATVRLDVHFVDAVQVGEFVEAKCQVVRRGRPWGRGDATGQLHPSGAAAGRDRQGRHRGEIL